MPTIYSNLLLNIPAFLPIMIYANRSHIKLRFMAPKANKTNSITITVANGSILKRERLPLVIKFFLESDLPLPPR